MPVIGIGDDFLTVRRQIGLWELITIKDYNIGTIKCEITYIA